MKFFNSLVLCGLLSQHLASAQPVAVGDTVCVEGFIMDTFCIARGTLYDYPKIITLEEPGEHSLHCLLDVSVCNKSEYNILKEPEGNGLYSIAYEVDDDGKDMLIDIGREVGKEGKFPACQTCTDEGSLLKGFRAEVTGVVTDLGNGDNDPPKLTVTSALASNGRSDFCSATQQQVTDSPTIAPTGSPSAPPMNTPTQAPSTRVPTTIAPSGSPSAPPMNTPTQAPSTRIPTTIAPSGSPSAPPMNTPTQAPSTRIPTTIAPSGSPSASPMNTPTQAPSTRVPTSAPSASPTMPPTSSAVPTMFTKAPTIVVTDPPSESPSDQPSRPPSPSETPSSAPSMSPTMTPVSGARSIAYALSMVLASIVSLLL